MTEETKEMTYEEQVALQKQYVKEAYGEDVDVYDTDEMVSKFEALGFAAPFVVVRRREDKVKGTLQFIHMPRVYFKFIPE